MNKLTLILLILFSFTIYAKNIEKTEKTKNEKKIIKKDTKDKFKEPEYDKDQFMASFGLDNTEKNPFNSALASLFIPGLGQAYNADFKKGLLFFAGFALSKTYYVQIRILAVAEGAITSFLRTRKIRNRKKKYEKKTK